MRIALVFVALAALAGCASPTQDATPTPKAVQSEAAPTAAAPTEEEPAEESPAAEEATACEDVSADLLAKVQAGAQEGTGMVVTRGAAYRSPDFEKVWFVAAEFTATGVEPQVGVWATNSLDPSAGILMSADNMAKQFTVWPDAATTDAQIATTDPAIGSALDCLG